MCQFRRKFSFSRRETNFHHGIRRWRWLLSSSERLWFSNRWRATTPQPRLKIDYKRNMFTGTFWRNYFFFFFFFFFKWVIIVIFWKGNQGLSNGTQKSRYWCELICIRSSLLPPKERADSMCLSDTSEITLLRTLFASRIAEEWGPLWRQKDFDVHQVLCVVCK